MGFPITDFPAEVIEQILLFAPSPRAVTRVGGTCSTLQELVTTNERIWNKLYTRRWIKSSRLTYTRQNYVDRHGQDAETIRRLNLVVDAVKTKTDYGLDHEYTYRMPAWLELTEGMNSLEILSLIARNGAQIKTLYSHVNVTPFLRALATDLLVQVHCRHVLKDLKALKEAIQKEEIDNMNALEQGSLLVSQCMLSWKDLLLPENEAPRYSCRLSRAKLDELGNQLQNRLDSRGGVKVLGTLGVVDLLNTILTEDMGFAGFAGNFLNYYDEKNSSIDHVLKTGKGIPLTRVVIYKLILHRVGVMVDIIGLPGHVVLGLPDEETFVDVYNGTPFENGCRSLSVEDCRNMVESYQEEWNQVEWNIQILTPLTVMDTLLRMVRNAQVCQTMLAWRQSRTTGISDSILRLKHFQGILLALDFYMKESFHGMLRDGTTFVDPEIFRHFDLIDDATMRRLWRVHHALG